MSSTGHASKMKFTRSRYKVTNTFSCVLCKAKEVQKKFIVALTDSFGKCSDITEADI